MHRLKRIITSKVFILFLVTLLIVGIVAAVLLVRHENRRHALIDESVSNLQSELLEAGLPAEKSSGCGRGQVKFGKGPKHCRVGLSMKADEVSDEETIRLYDTLRLTIEKDQSFIAKRTFAEEFDMSKEGATSYYQTAYYIDKKTQSECGAGFRYSSKKNHYTSAYNSGLIDAYFSCDDDSWLINTFQTGQWGF